MQKKAKATKSESKKVSVYNRALEKERKKLKELANDNPSTHESLLDDDRKGEVNTITEGQMKEEGSDNQIIEKQIKREKLGDLYVPAINAFVDGIIQERRKDFVKKTEQKSGNWTLDPPKQNADLPKWPSIAKQHDNTVLHNQVDRKPDEALVGGKIVKASIDQTVAAIKTGETLDYDAKIVDVLKKANEEKRDLNSSEKEQINNLKKARSEKYLKMV